MSAWTLKAKDYLVLCKPKVVLTMLVTSWVGMQLAVTEATSIWIFIVASLGIGLAGGSAAAINHLVDAEIDKKMLRTYKRPIAQGRILPKDAIIFALVLGTAGIGILRIYINTLTAYLTFFTLIAYAFFYTMYLKRATPQNIVIGGIAGATPPLLGWTAVSNQLNPESLLLVLIIFIWTPPHFWALAIDRKEDYANSNIPMLPNTHGVEFTKLCILLYTFLLFAISLMPYVIQMSGHFYLFAAIILNSIFLYFAFKLYLSKQKKWAMQTFNYSIIYILLLFLALIIDYHFKF